jgi:predicted phage gp36 major capsid-like protein
MTNDATTRRQVALKLIRIDLFGASYKIETERFSEARATLSDYLAVCKRTRSIDARASVCREVLRDITALERSAKQSKVLALAEQDECMREDADRGRYVYGD